MGGLIVLLALLVLNVLGFHDPRPIVQVRQGKVQGIRALNAKGREYYAFRGIPYGRPPVNELRFKRPEPALPWSEVRDGAIPGPVCIQYDMFITKSKYGQEDCLYLNVYSPEAPQPHAGKAVMVWIHGVAFVFGSGNEDFYGAGKFMDHDVILVTINYRLGAFGFLSTADEVIPGNFGLWDQTLALVWVQENIAAFGGDPGKVTIFGESAGGCSVSLHILSRQSAGLFSRAIMQSGTALNPWGIQEDPLPYARKIGSAVNCPIYPSHTLLDCLRTIDANVLLDAYISTSVHETVAPLAFVPVVENHKLQRFLEDQPYQLLKRKQFNQVPTIAGLMGNEAALFFNENAKSRKYHHLDAAFIGGHLNILLADITDFRSRLPEVANRLRREYFDKVDLHDLNQVKWPMMEMMSAASFDAGVQQFARRLSKVDPHRTYMYVMTYRGALSATKLVFNITEDLGPTHFDDVLYMFDVDALGGSKLSGHDEIVSQRLLTLWTAFAKNGVPNPKSRELVAVDWRPVTYHNDMQYLKIDRILTMERGYKLDMMRLWNVILPKINMGKPLKPHEEL